MNTTNFLVALTVIVLSSTPATHASSADVEAAGVAAKRVLRGQVTIDDRQLKKDPNKLKGNGGGNGGGNSNTEPEPLPPVEEPTTEEEPTTDTLCQPNAPCDAASPSTCQSGQLECCGAFITEYDCFCDVGEGIYFCATPGCWCPTTTDPTTR